MKNSVMLGLLGALLVPQLALGAVGTAGLSKEVRGRSVCIPRYITTSSAAAGSLGVIFGGSLGGLTTLTSATMAGMPFPSKVAYQLIEAGQDLTMTCSALTITGKDQFGNSVVHRDSTLTETEEFTTVAFSKVEGVAVSGCTGATGVGDRLRLAISKHIGLRSKVRVYQDLESACIVDASDSSNMKCAFSNDGGSTDLQSVLDTTNNTLDVSSVIFGATKVAAAVADTICWTVRPSF